MNIKKVLRFFSLSFFSLAISTPFMALATSNGKDLAKESSIASNAIKGYLALSAISGVASCTFPTEKPKYKKVKQEIAR